MSKKADIKFWILIVTGSLLAVLLVVGQMLALVDFDLAVIIGLQESVEEVGRVGIAFAKGFALADSLFYLPMLIAGIIGLLKRKSWGFYSMFGSLAITAYWPVVHLYAIYTEKVAIVLSPDKYISYSITLPILTVYGLWGMWYLFKNKTILSS